MQNKKYYLVSPRVDGNTIQGFLETMFEQHIVMMGWGTDNKIGADFNNLNKGDFVIVAQRVNWVFTYYFAGIIDDEQGFSNDDGFLCRKLRNFIDLRGCNDDLLADVSFASMSVIKAMMNINQSNNIEIIKKLDKIIAMQENKDYVNSFVSLLKSNHNLILTGAPGTGKTYLAKKIAKEMGATQDNGACKMVQFHPSYDYTDFVEGLRPIKKGDTLGFERKDGVFKKFCKKALENLNNNNNTKEQITTIDNAFSKLWEKINKGEIKTLKLFNGGETLPMIVKQDNKRMIYFSQKNNLNVISTGNEVSLDKVKKAFEDYKITTIQKLNDSGPNRDELGSGGNVSNLWAIMYYLLTSMENIKNGNFENSNNNNYVFIIDEINRGEISKIFGELFYSIDPGYRGEDCIVETQYQNLIPKEGDSDFDSTNPDVFREGFYVPKNVYIIGTMNDIDRSVESMDFAMRRRFAWKEITAKSRQSMLDEDDTWKPPYEKPSQDIIDEIKARMDNLNAAIIDQYEDEALSNKDKIGLSKAYQIGAAYFLKYALYKDLENPFEELWTNHLKGLLYEYLRGKTNIDEKINILYRAFNDTKTH